MTLAYYVLLFYSLELVVKRPLNPSWPNRNTRCTFSVLRNNTSTVFIFVSPIWS